jgi:hypothetical protein
MDEIRVTTWLELQERLFEDSDAHDLGRFRSSYAFRGRGRASDELTTTLQRLGAGFEEVERHLLRNFRKYARRDAVAVDSLWDWLALAKHHTVPTRLLDWTFSPYVALHFLTAGPDGFDEDGVVWCVDYVRASEWLPAPLAQALRDEGSDVFSAELLAGAVPDLATLDRLADEPFPLFFEPPSIDARIVNQYALFSLMSSASARLDEWLAERPGIARRVIVPAELKPEIRDKLDQANVTERVLFPGLDGLARWLARYYTPVPSGARS